jgi:hypothetical protein
MAANGKLFWQGDDVLAQVEAAKNVILDEMAFAIEAEAKNNIVGNNQVDTGFMLNSTYAVTQQQSSYGKARAAARSKNPDAEIAPEERAPRGGAAVVVGAEYAIYQEERRSFLYKAGQDVARQAGGIITRHKL